MAMNLEQLFERLNPEEIKILKEQIARFQNCSTMPRQDIKIDKEIILPEGTLIHGTPVNKDTLSSIANTGIITGQAFGIEEDGETFYCADFHRTNKDISLKDYNENFTYIDARCPFGRRGKFTLAFVIYPNENIKKLIAYDCYKNSTEESDITKKFVNTKALPIEDGSIVSSILFGIPSNFISGIILGDNSINEDMVSFLIEQYPGVFITRNNGELIYQKDDSKELVSTRIKSINRQIELEEKNKTIEDTNKRNAMQKQEIDKLWKAISTLPVEVITQIYDSLGYQGDHIQQAERLKKQYEEKSGMKI